MVGKIQQEEVKRILMNSFRECKYEFVREDYSFFYEDKRGNIRCLTIDPYYSMMISAQNEIAFDAKNLSMPEFQSASSYYLSDIYDNVSKFIENLTKFIENLNNNARVILDIHREVFGGVHDPCTGALAEAERILEGEKRDIDYNLELKKIIKYYVYDDLDFLFSSDPGVFKTEVVERVLKYIKKYINDPSIQSYAYNTITDKLKKELIEVEEKVNTYRCIALKKDYYTPIMKLICRPFVDMEDKDVVEATVRRIYDEAMDKMRKFLLGIAKEGVNRNQFCSDFNPEDVISDEIEEYLNTLKEHGIFIVRVNLSLE